MAGGEADTRTAIMEATYDALVEHGYADLTIQTIADEFEKSKSLLYYHYESKEDILREFLGYLLEEFSTEVSTLELGENPEGDLLTVLDLLLPTGSDAELRSLRLALLDLQLQAAYEATYRESMGQLLSGLLNVIEEVIRAGIEDGTFRSDVDPESQAELLLAVITGISFNELTLRPDSRQRTRAAIEDHVEDLLAD